MEQATNDKIIRIIGDDIPYISIPKSEYDHLIQCKQELLLLKQQVNSKMQNKINNAFQEAMMMEQKVSNVMSTRINLWY